jgi:hypothetical protein
VNDYRFQDGKPYPYILAPGESLPFSGYGRYQKIKQEKEAKGTAGRVAAQKSGVIAFLCSLTVIPLCMQVRYIRKQQKRNV